MKRLSRLEKDQIPFQSIINKAKINYDNLESITYAKEITSDFSKIDTLSVFIVKWNDSLAKPEEIINDRNKLEKWLLLELGLDTLVVKKAD